MEIGERIYKCRFFPSLPPRCCYVQLGYKQDEDLDGVAILPKFYDKNGYEVKISELINQLKEDRDTHVPVTIFVKASNHKEVFLLKNVHLNPRKFKDNFNEALHSSKTITIVLDRKISYLKRFFNKLINLMNYLRKVVFRYKNGYGILQPKLKNYTEDLDFQIKKIE